MPEALGLAQWLVIAVAAQRISELFIARRNTARLLARGGVEIGRGHYLPIVVLHAAWLVAIFLRIPPDATAHYWLIGLFIALQAARFWVLASLGPYWTTRVVTVPNAPLVTRGPYRWCRHPNYLIVALEIAVLPLAFSDWLVAIAFSAGNALLMCVRIPAENRALDVRRSCTER